MKINSTGTSRSTTLDLGRVQRISSAPPDKYYITEVIKRDRLSKYPQYIACYRVGVNGEHSNFYIVQNKNCRTNDIFAVHYNKTDKDRGLLFPTTSDASKPVAIVDGSVAGLLGYFEIFDIDEYYARFQLTPFIHVPDHTEVNSKFLLAVDNAFKKLPVGMLQALCDSGVAVILGKNVEDTYYHYFPRWEAEDLRCTIDPTKPRLEKTEDDWIDNRLRKNVPGRFVDNRIFIPQTYTQYGTEDHIIDCTNEGISLGSIVVHEAGHVIDAMYEPILSDLEGFQEAHAQDVENIPLDQQDKVLYLIALRKDAFTEILAALLNCLPHERTYTILNHFPKSSEYIRQHVLPLIGVNMNIDDVRENVYSNYLRSEFSKRLRQISSTFHK